MNRRNRKMYYIIAILLVAMFKYGFSYLKEHNTNINLPKISQNKTVRQENVSVNNQEIQSLLKSVKIAEPDGSKYNRTEWDGNTKFTERDGKMYTARNYNLYFSPNYKGSSTSFEYIDPYSNKNIEKKSLIDRDHIIPIGYVNQHGGASWSAEKKRDYAFDVTVSVDVHRTLNRTKGDKGPAKWMTPANQESYCYTWLVIANKYDISISQEDYNVIAETLKNTKEVSIINPLK